MQSLSVDHNHDTGYIRGLLCNKCNWGLMGYLRDDKTLVQRLIKYLQESVDKDKMWG